jgi:AcrR family transcriptional regulator
LRTEIIDAATRLLASGGEDEPLSLRAVAREIGVAPQSVYLQFQTKSELLMAVVEMFFAELQRHIDKAKAPLADARARLRAHCLAYCDYGLSSPGHYKLLFESRLTRQLGIGYQGSPGSRVFESFLGAVRHCVSPQASAPEMFREAVVLWAELHGMVSLRSSKPGFPWPPAETMVDRVLEALNLR